MILSEETKKCLYKLIREGAERITTAYVESIIETIEEETAEKDEEEQK